MHSHTQSFKTLKWIDRENAKNIEETREKRPNASWKTSQKQRQQQKLNLILLFRRLIISICGVQERYTEQAVTMLLLSSFTCIRLQVRSLFH